MKAVLSWFDYSTVMVKPWADAGYLCYCVDLDHAPGKSKNGNIICVGEDVRKWKLPDHEWIFASFFTPCTNMAVSGARWFRGKGLRKLAESIELFAESAEMAEYLGCPYFIENPVSTISTYWRLPDFTFDPCDYGDPYTKKTCLWTGGAL